MATKSINFRLTYVPLLPWAKWLEVRPTFWLHTSPWVGKLFSLLSPPLCQRPPFGCKWQHLLAWWVGAYQFWPGASITIVFSIMNIRMPYTTNSIMSGLNLTTACKNSLTKGYMGLSCTFKNPKTPTYFPQCTSLLATQLKKKIHFN
jgi:hypothetical protein